MSKANILYSFGLKWLILVFCHILVYHVTVCYFLISLIHFGLILVLQQLITVSCSNAINELFFLLLYCHCCEPLDSEPEWGEISQLYYEILKPEITKQNVTEWTNLAMKIKQGISKENKTYSHESFSQPYLVFLIYVSSIHTICPISLKFHMKVFLNIIYIQIIHYMYISRSVLQKLKICQWSCVWWTNF